MALQVVEPLNHWPVNLSKSADCVQPCLTSAIEVLQIEF